MCPAIMTLTCLLEAIIMTLRAFCQIRPWDAEGRQPCRMEVVPFAFDKKRVLEIMVAILIFL